MMLAFILVAALLVGTSVAAAQGLAITVSAGQAGFVFNKGAIPIDPNLTVVGTSTINGATVAIANGFVAGDSLAFMPVNGIAGSFNSATGVLTLSGARSPADFQAALRTVKFNTTAASSNAPRVVQFTLGFAKAFSGNGHFYEFVSGAAVAWKDAKAQAAARNLYGLKGYLATPTTAAENAYIQRLLTGPAWMGACVSSSGSMLTSFPGFPRTWYWCAGPEIGQKLCNNSSSGAYTSAGGVNGSYTNWSGGEPNNFSGIEGCAAYYSNGMWNDQACDTRATLSGFVVEYGGTPGDPQIVLSGSRNVNFSAK